MELDDKGVNLYHKGLSGIVPHVQDPDVLARVLEEFDPTGTQDAQVHHSGNVMVSTLGVCGVLHTSNPWHLGYTFWCL